MSGQSVEGRSQLKKDELNEKQRKAGVHRRPTAVEKVLEKGKKNFYTIGYGHYLDDSKEAIAGFKKAWGPPRDDGKVEGKGWKTKRAELQKGIGTIPEDVVEKLLDFDITRKIKTAKRIFGTKVFNDFPQAVKDAVINGVFRGEYTAGQKTVDLLKKGDYAGAAKNYIDREDYRASKRSKNFRGVAIRMDRNQAAFLSMVDKYERDPDPKRKGYFRPKQVAAPVDQQGGTIPAAVPEYNNRNLAKSRWIAPADAKDASEVEFYNSRMREKGAYLLSYTRNGKNMVGVGFDLDAPNAKQRFMDTLKDMAGVGNDVEQFFDEVFNGDKPLLKSHMDALLQADVAQAKSDAATLTKNYHALPKRVSNALTHMVLDMGVKAVRGVEGLIESLDKPNPNWSATSLAIQNSEFSKSSPSLSQLAVENFAKIQEEVSKRRQKSGAADKAPEVAANKPAENKAAVADKKPPGWNLWKLYGGK